MRFKTTFVAIFFVAVLAFGLAFFIYRDWRGAGDLPPTAPDDLNLNQVSDPADSSLGKELLDEGIKNEGPQSGIVKEREDNIIPPDLNRFIVNAKVSEEKKVEYISKMRDLASALKDDYDLYYEWLELASWRKNAEDYQGARDIWIYMTKRWPNDKTPYENLGNLHHFYIKDYPQAEKYMRLLLSKDPKYLNAYLNLYELYTLSYKEKNALAPLILEEGLKALPDNIALLFTMGEYYKDKDAVKAKEAYNKVLVLAKAQGDSKLEARVLDVLSSL